MEDRHLLAISLGVSTIGLVILAYLSTALAPTEISSISPDDIGSRVYIKGWVSDFSPSKDGHLFFELTDETGSIKTVIFKDVAKELPCIEEGVMLELRGFVDEFRGEIEVIPSTPADVKC